MKRVHLIKQNDEKTCGVACVCMIAQFYGKKLPMATVREAVKVDQYGASIFGLIDGARKFELEGEAFTGSAEDAWNALSEETDLFPVIIRILNRVGFEHYIVAVGMKREKLQVCDPDAGRMAMTREQFEACFLGEIITFKPMPGFKKENACRGQFSRFTNMLMKQKKLLAVIGALSFVVTAVGMLSAFLFQYIIDGGISNLDADGKERMLGSLMLILGGLAVLYLIQFGVQLLRGKLLTVLSRNLDLPLMLGYYDHITGLPIDFFETRKTGEIMSRFGDASKIRDALSNAALTVLIDVVMVIFCGIILFYQSHTLFLVAIGIFCAYILVTVLYVKPLDKMNRDTMEKNAIFNSYLKESVDAMETIKTAQAEKTVRTNAGNLFREAIDAGLKGAMLSLGKDTIIETITSLGTLVLILLGVVNILNGDLTVGGLVTFYSLMNYFTSPVQGLVELQGNIQSALVAADRLNDVLNLKTEKLDGVIPETEIEQIAVENVDFRYGNRELVLNDLKISLEKGEQIGLVGESGSGKSTASKLLMGMYQPERGSVTVNGISMDKLSLYWLRERTAYVPQTVSLFSGSIRENLVLGIPEEKIPSDEEITRILHACCCEFVFDMLFGIDSMLEENGVNLSGGQRQLLALARAVLRQPQLLVLDEATSALDTVTEYRVQKAIRELLPNAAVIMVAHRLSTIANCSRILVIEHGHVIEEGRHDELLVMNGKYSELWNKQNLGLKFED